MKFVIDMSNIHELNSRKDFLRSKPVSRWFKIDKAGGGSALGNLQPLRPSRS